MIPPDPSARRPTCLPPSTAASAAQSAITAQPRMVPGLAPAIDPAGLEELLADWFEAPVVLYSSGRAGAQSLLAEWGLHLYRHTITVPNFVSDCILSALMRNAFPVRSGGDAVLFYHQYGLLQSVAPREPLVIEDICHAFFATPRTGARRWVGAAAMFSPPKFFPTGGRLGGLVVPDPHLAARLRERRDRTPDIDPDLGRWRREVTVRCHLEGGTSSALPLLDAAYALLVDYPKPDPATLSGVPVRLGDIAEIGAARLERLERYAAGLGDLFPRALMPDGLGTIPYAVPYFVAGNASAVVERLAGLGIGVGTVNIDVGRNTYRPDYRLAILLPCHDNMPLDLIDEACDALATC